jgi:predicted enzyme related to lactoylglutathione lyase
VFGWKVRHRPELNYRIFETGNKMGINGGILQPDREGPWPGNQIFYVAVDDLGKFNRKIERAGGKIHVEEQEIAGMGWLSLFTDPEGRMNGLFKPMMPAKKARKPAKKAGRKK